MFSVGDKLKGARPKPSPATSPRSRSFCLRESATLVELKKALLHRDTDEALFLLEALGYDFFHSDGHVAVYTYTSSSTSAALL